MNIIKPISLIIGILFTQICFAQMLTPNEDSTYYDNWVGEWYQEIDGEISEEPTFIVKRALYHNSFEELWIEPDGIYSKAWRAWDNRTKKWGFAWMASDGLFQTWEGKKVDGIWYIYKTFLIEDKEVLSRQAFILTDENTLLRTSEHSRDDGKTWKLRFKEKYIKLDRSQNAIAKETEQQDTPKSVCQQYDVFRQLDFWIGDWRVENPDGTLAGYNKIEPILSECVLLENWTGNGPSRGKSFNYYNYETKKWHQQWVNNDGRPLEFEGIVKGDTIFYTGESKNLEGNKIYHKLTISKVNDNQVRQLWEQSEDKEKWIVIFDGRYIRQNREKQDRESIEKACFSYLEGFYEGDTTKLKSCLKPSLYKFGYWKNKKTEQYESDGQMTFEQAVKYAKRVKEKQEFAAKNVPKEVEVLSVSNHVAAAKITAWWGIDYALLSKQNGKWVIEQVLWEGPLEK